MHENVCMRACMTTRCAHLLKALIVKLANVVFPSNPAVHWYCEVPASNDVSITSCDSEGSINPVTACTPAISRSEVTLVQFRGTVGWEGTTQLREMLSGVSGSRRITVGPAEGVMEASPRTVSEWVTSDEFVDSIATTWQRTACTVWSKNGKQRIQPSILPRKQTRHPFTLNATQYLPTCTVLLSHS